jgi:hypothetical protein
MNSTSLCGRVPRPATLSLRLSLPHQPLPTPGCCRKPPLLNDVSPVDALVSSTGQAVTFDNWHSVGHGSDTVVIYDAQGNVVRALALHDFLPDDYIGALPHSVSSLHWGGEHCITGGDRRLVLRVAVPPLGFRRDAEREYVDVVVDLASGRITVPQGKARMLARVRAWTVNALRWP